MTVRKTNYKGATKEASQKIVQLVPLNENQANYINALGRNSQVVVVGYSGTGKTYIAATVAANLYLQKIIHKIVITRPNVAVGKDLGYLPGDLYEKFAPWAMPVLDVLKKHLGDGVFDTALKAGNIEMAPLSLMRGRSFEDAFIILDEAQNTSVAEIKMFLTRIGENCKVVVNGDIRQSDIQGQSGLSKIIHLAKKNNLPIPVIEFGVDDIVRSDICKQWIISFEGEGL
jgi:phosphate starvation-inducible PhoH-like protein